MNAKRRAVITGIGVIAPNGLDLDTFWSSVCQPLSAASFITRFDTKDFPTKVGCVLTGFDAADYMNPKMARRYDPYIQYSVAASVLAVKDAKINLARFDPNRIGVVEGTTIGGLNT